MVEWAMEMKEAYNVVLYTTYPSSNLIQTQNATTLFGSLKFGSPDLLREKNYFITEKYC